MQTSINLANNFYAALAYTQQMRDKYLTSFYKKYSLDGRYVFIEKSACSTMLQKELAVDTIFQSRKSGSLCIEEKIERKYTGNFALETESCTKPGHERGGWMRYAEADYLLYAFAVSTGLDVYLIDFPKLRSWFWDSEERLPLRFRPHVMDTHNRTLIKIVPIEDVKQEVGYLRYLCTEEMCMRVSA